MCFSVKNEQNRKPLLTRMRGDRIDRKRALPISAGPRFGRNFLYRKLKASFLERRVSANLFLDERTDEGYGHPGQDGSSARTSASSVSASLKRRNFITPKRLSLSNRRFLNRSDVCINIYMSILLHVYSPSYGRLPRSSECTIIIDNLIYNSSEYL